MPKTQCCVPLCFNRGGVLFPSDKRPDVRQQWIYAIKREDGKKRVWEPSPTSLVCHSHFAPSDYIQETVYGMYGINTTGCSFGCILLLSKVICRKLKLGKPDLRHI